jgi:membrane associated rhomboid family serine protease
MTTTPVGMRCPECAKQGTKVMRLREMATLPRVTYALIAINVVAFLTEQGQFTLFGSNIHVTAVGTSVGNGAVIDNGILDRFDISVNHEYWRLVSAGFLHENLLHIAFNMYLLYLLGLMLEPAIGSVRFAAVYFAALLAGSFGALLATAAPSLGASGAVFGLMGAMVVELRARRLSVMESGIGGLILINLILSFSLANISVGAHVGGLIGGALAGLAVRAAGDRYKLLGLFACLALAAICVAGAIAVAGVSGTGFA